MATDRPSNLPFHPALPSALSPPTDGKEELAALVGATILRIGTTDPGVFEGGGLIIDYCATGSAETCRLVLAFSERGMWVEQSQSLSS